MTTGTTSSAAPTPAASTDDARTGSGRKRLLFLLPALVFVVVGVFLAIGLTRDPSTLPSALAGKPAPEFALPPIPGRDTEGF